jgi:hypothetical protein
LVISSDNFDQLYAEFIDSPSLSDYSDETAVHTEQDVFANESSLKEVDHHETQQLAEPQDVQSTIRIRLRVEPPKPRVILRLTKPTAKKGKGAKPLFKNQWEKGR